MQTGVWRVWRVWMWTFINSEYFILVCQAEVTVALPLFPYRKFI
ncbi:hypothetical protein AS94_10810 [Staphylococcus aureus subsp. aureus 300-169]|nr:hypothetical protein AS94_10810 [Staphylococcus aureus subsp. aureus 300-169]EUN38755.1 hypothetical protein AS94_07505 [Staphylococcus aureus subsp. aureus 301-188]